jgi:hypothetical protein
MIIYGERNEGTCLVAIAEDIDHDTEECGCDATDPWHLCVLCGERIEGGQDIIRDIDEFGWFGKSIHYSHIGAKVDYGVRSGGFVCANAWHGVGVDIAGATFVDDGVYLGYWSQQMEDDGFGYAEPMQMHYERLATG